MPRIRKKTSNRQSTNDRRKIQKKVKESKKKRTRASKKETVQWKSKHKKDPGIPNNFPYKDEILKEVAEQRRQAAELKQRQKEEKRASRNKTTDEQNPDVDMDADVDDADTKLSPEDIAQGIADITARSFPASAAKTRQAPQAEQSDEEEGIPVLVNRDLPNLGSVLDNADVVVYLLDARDPLAFRVGALEKEVVGRKKKLVLLLNKIDLCPREAVDAWAAQLRLEHPTLLFRSATSQLPSSADSSTPAVKRGKGKAAAGLSDDAWGVTELISLLEESKPKKKSDALKVAVVGVTNVGKSSFINSMSGKAALPTYSISSCTRGSTTTTLPQEVIIETASGRKIQFTDTPGFSWEGSAAELSEEEQGEAEARRVKDILARNRGRIDKLKDPKAAASQIVERCSYEDLMLFYNLPAFIKGNVDSFLAGLARSQRLIKKHGEVDLAGACRILLRDWNTDKFPRYTVPPSTPEQPSSSTKSTPASLSKIYSANQEILQKVASRKERMIGSGVVKLAPVTIETRKVDLAGSWEAEDDDGDSEMDEDDANLALDDEEGDDEEEDADGSDEEVDEEHESEDDDEDEEDVPPPSKKRKAKSAPGPTKPSKKVSFAAPPPSASRSKQPKGPQQKKGTTKRRS